MRATRERTGYRYVHSASYTGALNRRSGPVRRRFAILAITCAVLVVAAIVAMGLAA